MALLLTEREVEGLVGFEDMLEAVDLIEAAYRQKARGKATLHPRLTLQYPPGEGYYSDVALRLLPGILPEMNSVAFRVYPIYHDHEVKERGPRVLDYIMGQELLVYYRYADRMSLTAIMADYRIMNLRTAAPTGVATRWLAREDSKILGVLGAGRHAPWQVAAVAAVRPLEEVRIFSPTPRNRERVAEELNQRLSAHVYAVDSGREAVADADIVITVTNANRPVLQADWLKDGVHVNVIARGEIDEETILRAGTISCSYREQILRDTPDFIPVPDMIRKGKIEEERFRDLDEFIDHPLRGRKDNRETTLFLSQGVGMWDAAMASWVYERALAAGVGTRFDFGS